MKQNELVLNEELVEKVINQLCAVLDYVEEAENDEHKHRQLEIWAGWIIEGILSAVRDGQKIPGEVGRCSRPTVLIDPDVLIDWVQHTRDFHKADLFIALCREERKEDG